MTIYDHNHKDRVVLELSEQEFLLINFLIEKAAKQAKNKDALSVQMLTEFKKYEKEVPT